MTVQIYGYPTSTRVRVALVVAEYEGIPIDLVRTDPHHNVGLDQEPYKSEFPFKRVPCMIDGDIKISQVVAISEYLAAMNNKSNLLGKTKKDRAEIMQWSIWATADFGPLLAAWFRPLLGIAPYNKKSVDDAEKGATDMVDILETYLHTRTFFVGERLSLADISIASWFHRGLPAIFDKPFRSKHPNVFRWFETVVNQPPYLKVAGGPVEAGYIDKQVEPPKAAPKAKAEPKPKAEPAPKAAAAAKPAKKEKEAEDDDEPAVPAEPKAKHPCEALGPAKSFPFDEWKRQYSNNDTPDALKWLKENLKDSSDYSFWKATYKYPTELTQVFMSSNLIGGFHNRLEGSRKYLFGSSGVYGTNNDSAIQGVYMVRGTDYKPVFDVAPDAESYEFEKLDFDKDHSLIAQVWSWEGDLGGKKFADGKVFK